MNSTTTTQQKITAMVEIFKAIIYAVKAAGELGAPAGIVYAALMTGGCTHAQFEKITGAMVGAGLLKKSGHIFHVGPNAAKLG